MDFVAIEKKPKLILEPHRRGRVPREKAKQHKILPKIPLATHHPSSIWVGVSTTGCKRQVGTVIEDEPNRVVPSFLYCMGTKGLHVNSQRVHYIRNKCGLVQSGW